MDMSAVGTTTVEIDSELLGRLRERSPGRSDRETLERVARIQLGFETIRRVQERNTASGVNDQEVMAEERARGPGSPRRLPRAVRDVADPEDIEPLLRHPEDDYLLALARTANATAIVTGDKDLLDRPEELDPPAIHANAACELTGLTKPS
jgi:predicted nucleic acid-binding protein